MVWGGVKLPRFSENCHFGEESPKFLKIAVSTFLLQLLVYDFDLLMLVRKKKNFWVPFRVQHEFFAVAGLSSVKGPFRETTGPFQFARSIAEMVSVLSFFLGGPGHPS